MDTRRQDFLKSGAWRRKRVYKAGVCDGGEDGNRWRNVPVCHGSDATCRARWGVGVPGCLAEPDLRLAVSVGDSGWGINVTEKNRMPPDLFVKKAFLLLRTRKLIVKWVTST